MDGINVLGLGVQSFTQGEADDIQDLLHDDGGGHQPTIVYFHKAMYTGNDRVNAICPNQSDDSICNRLQPVFEEEGVDLVIAGHAHDYEHLEVNGVTYLVIGGAGAKFQPDDVPDVVNETVVRGLYDGDLFHHWVQVDTTAGGLDVTVWRVFENGSGNTEDEEYETISVPTAGTPGVVSGSMDFTVTDQGGPNETWEVVWETDNPAHQKLDRVHVTRVSQAGATCPASVTLSWNTPDVAIEVVPNGDETGYVHTLTWTDPPDCPGGPCGWYVKASSAVEAGGNETRQYTSQELHMCPKPPPPPPPPPHQQAPAVPGFVSVSPNPLRDPTVIRFVLEDRGTASLRVFNVRGERVRTLAEGVLSAGEHAVAWNGLGDAGNALPNGVYLLTLETELETFTTQVTLLR